MIGKQLSIAEARHRLARRIFGRTAAEAFVRSTVRDHSLKAWKRAGLEPLTPHEARHTCVSYLIAAGVNAKALQTFMGHSSIPVTLDRYGHLFPGSEGEAAVLLDAYLAEAYERAREADPEGCGKNAGKNYPLSEPLLAALGGEQDR